MKSEKRSAEAEKLKNELETEIQKEILENFDEFTDLKEAIEKKINECEGEVEDKFKELYR